MTGGSSAARSPAQPRLLGHRPSSPPARWWSPRGGPCAAPIPLGSQPGCPPPWGATRLSPACAPLCCPGSPEPLRPVEVAETLAQGRTCSSSGPVTTFCRSACRSWRAGAPPSLPGPPATPVPCSSRGHARRPRSPRPWALLLCVRPPPAPPWRAPWAVVCHWLPSQSPPKRMTPGGELGVSFFLCCIPRMLLAPGRNLVHRGSQGRKLRSACTSVLPTYRSLLLSASCSRARPLQACAPARGDAGSVPGWVVWPRGVSRQGCLASGVTVSGPPCTVASASTSVWLVMNALC